MYNLQTSIFHTSRKSFVALLYDDDWTQELLGFSVCAI